MFVEKFIVYELGALHKQGVGNERELSFMWYMALQNINQGIV